MVFVDQKVAYLADDVTCLACLQTTYLAYQIHVTTVVTARKLSTQLPANALLELLENGVITEVSNYMFCDYDYKYRIIVT